MSRETQPKNKRLDKLEVMEASEVWEVKNGKYVIRPELDIYGRVEKGSSAFVTKHNRNGENHKFVDDTSVLNRNTKQKITDLFQNKRRKVAYLVKKKTNKER